MAKIGRNEPCPCGSGRKYKRCCLCKEQEAKAATSAVISDNHRDALAFTLATTVEDVWAMRRPV